MDNYTETFSQNTINGNEHLPLDAFYEELRENNFTVTSYQVINANKIIIQYANQVKSEEELCNYLAPLFASSEEEQVLFREIYRAHFKPKQIIHTSWQNNATNKIKKNWKLFITAYSAFALIVIAVLITLSYNYYHRYQSKAITEKDLADITYSLSTNPTTEKSYLTEFQAKTNKPIQVFIKAYYKEKEKLTLSNIQYDWGDSTTIDTISSHTYHTTGNYPLTIYADVTSEDLYLKKQAINGTVNVCADDNYLKIKKPTTDTLRLNQKIKLIAEISGSTIPTTIEWETDGKISATDQKDLVVSFKTIGKHTVTCVTIYDDINSPCTLRSNVDLFVPDTSSNPINASLKRPISSPQINRTIAPFLYYLWWTSLGIFLLLAIFFLILSEKAKKKITDLKNAAKNRYQQLVDALNGEKIKQQLPFKNKNYLPAHEPAIISVARQMRRRINDAISYLHIDRTIQRSIDNNGLFSPVMMARTRQTELLVLIDEMNSNNQLVKLFEYATGMLKKQNVLIETYYYKKIPLLCYNNIEPAPVSLEKLNKRYNNHILLLMGDAYQLINDQSGLDAECAALIQQWEYKAILTPVSFIDWGAKEKKILFPHIPVFPADLEGLSLLMEFFANKENGMNVMARLNQMKGLFYPVNEIEFINLQQLKYYCDKADWAIIYIRERPVNILFEWIKALTVYPKISWEITLAIGKTIFTKYGKGKDLNYTALLQLSRISWMKEGSFPHQLRVELLQALSIENETIARETVLQLLKEIPDSEIIPKSTAFEEKEIQQTINEFRLNAIDPVYYSIYKESEEVFKMLWKDNMIDDAAIIEKFKTDHATWKTFDDTIHHKNSDNTIETYFGLVAKEDSLMSRIFLWIGLISIFVAVSSYFALLMLDIWEKGN